MNPQNTQVLIIGAGPTGLSLAILLAQSGVSCRIIDKNAPRPKHESRAIGTHARTMQIFESFGVLEEMFAHGLKWRGFNFHQNGRQIGRLSFDKINSKFNFALVLPQAETERILREKLQDMGVGVEHETALLDFSQDADSVRTTIVKNRQTAEINSDFLIGCDGAKSVTRKLLNLDFAGKRLQGSYLIDCEADWRQKPLTEGNTFFASGWRLIVGELPENRRRVVVNLPHDDARMKFETPSLELMQNFVDEFGLKMTLKNASWASAFWLSVRCVEKMRVGRVFLAGDAAHNVCPNAGQGMNAGIHDAANLGAKLIDYLQKNVDSLDDYERTRMPVIKKLLTASERMENLMTLRNGIAATARNLALPLILKSNLLQQKIANQIAGVNIKN